MRTSLASLAGLVVVVGVAPFASANLVSNGDFSANAAAYQYANGYNGGTDTNGTNPSAPTDWSENSQGATGVGGVGGAGIYFGPQSNASAYQSNPTSAQDFGFVQSTGNYYDQTFTVTPGTTYVVGYTLGERLNDGGYVNGQPVGGSISTVSIQDGSYGGTTLGTSGPIPANPNMFVTEPDFTFVALSNTATIVLGNTSPGGDYTTDYTGVNVNPVPEPASLGLIGLAGLGMLRRRRRNV